MAWKSRQEIVKTYRDHLDSLRLSGVEYEEDGIMAEFDKELDAWDKENH